MKSTARISKLTVTVTHAVEYDLVHGVGCSKCAFHSSNWKGDHAPCLDMKDQNICTSKAMQDDTFGFVMKKIHGGTA
jgi:hypothetical protein